MCTQTACLVALQIQDVPDEVRDVLAGLAVARDQSLQAFLLALVIDEARRSSHLTLLDRFRDRRDGSRLSVSGIVIGDKNYFGRDVEDRLAGQGIRLLYPARKGECARPGSEFFKPLRQVIESIFDAFEGQLDLEQHGGRTISGVNVRVWQRLLALTGIHRGVGVGECGGMTRCPAVMGDWDLRRFQYPDREGRLWDGTLSHPCGDRGGLR